MLRPIIAGVSKEPMLIVKTYTVLARMPGSINGANTVRNICPNLAPWTVAASSSAGSIDRKLAAVRIKASAVRLSP